MNNNMSSADPTPAKYLKMGICFCEPPLNEAAQLLPEQLVAG
jgi:hypothetical protein